MVCILLRPSTHTDTTSDRCKKKSPRFVRSNFEFIWAFWIFQFFFYSAVVSGVPTVDLHRSVRYTHESTDTLNFKPMSEWKNMTKDRLFRKSSSHRSRESIGRIGSDMVSHEIRLLHVNSGSVHSGYHLPDEQTQHTTTGPRASREARRLFTYRPHLWRQLQVENCYNNPPPDLLSPRELEPVHALAPPKPIFYTNGVRHSRVGRLDEYPFIHKTRNGLKSSFSFKSIRAQRTNRTAPKENRQLSPRNFRRGMNSVSMGYQNGMVNNDPTGSELYSPVEISVHRLLIRPAILEVDDGNVNARLRYVIQLHRRLSGYYQLTMEARVNPEFPPLYVGKIHNICAHWPSNIPRSKCSVQNNRFYQRGQICFCHMPPGLYHQRLRLTMKDLLDGLDLPRYLVNFLFRGKKLHIYLTLKLENSSGEVVGCVNIKVPVLLKSA